MPKKFSKEYQPPAESKRKKKGKTIYKEKLNPKNIEELGGDCLRVFKEAVNSSDKSLSFLGAKEIAKYVFAQKREHTGEFKANLKVVFENIKKPNG